MLVTCPGRKGVRGGKIEKRVCARRAKFVRTDGIGLVFFRLQCWSIAKAKAGTTPRHMSLLYATNSNYESELTNMTLRGTTRNRWFIPAAGTYIMWAYVGKFGEVSYF